MIVIVFFILICELKSVNKRDIEFPRISKKLSMKMSRDPSRDQSLRKQSVPLTFRMPNLLSNHPLPKVFPAVFRVRKIKKRTKQTLFTTDISCIEMKKPLDEWDRVVFDLIHCLNEVDFTDSLIYSVSSVCVEKKRN